MTSARSSLRPRDKLRRGQLRIASIIKREPSAIIVADMGSGKTGGSLEAVYELSMSLSVRRVLVVAPLRVAVDTWPSEIETWEHTRCLSYTLIRAADDDEEMREFGNRIRREERQALRERGESPERAAKIAGQIATDEVAEAVRLKRERLATEETDIHIINREMIPWLVKFHGKNWPYDMLVYDEASRLKGGRTRTKGGKKREDLPPKKRTPAPLSEFGSLASVRHKFQKIVLLTGTLTSNGVIDMWGPVYIADGGERLGRTRTKFINRWFNYNHWTHQTTERPEAESEIVEATRDIIHGTLPEDQVDMPPVRANPIYVNLPPRVMQEYRRFERTLVSETYDVEAVSRGVLTNKLLQFANGSMYRGADPLRGRDQRDIVHVHNLKLDALDSVFEEAGRNSVLIAYSFKFDRDAIKKRFPEVTLFDQDPHFVDNWNAGKIRWGLTHPASMGHGLNLQYGGHIAVWYGLTWSLELYKQWCARLPRPGQPHPHVDIHHILARGTADENQFEVLNVRNATQERVNQAICLRVNPELTL